MVITTRENTYTYWTLITKFKNKPMIVLDIKNSVSLQPSSLRVINFISWSSSYNFFTFYMWKWIFYSSFTSQSREDNCFSWKPIYYPFHTILESFAVPNYIFLLLFFKSPRLPFSSLTKLSLVFRNFRKVFPRKWTRKEKLDHRKIEDKLKASTFTTSVLKVRVTFVS